MEGKHSLKHLYNKGKSSQMKPQEFIELMNWLDQNANGMIDEAVEVTEKIDGSSNFIGYDGRIYVETFGFDKKFYDENDFDGNPYEAKAKALLEYATSLPDLEDYLEDLCNDNNCASIKLQIEMLLTKFSKSEEYCQIVLVPYMFDKLGKDGNGFIIQVLNGDTLEPVKDEKLAVETLCDIMSTENFKVTGTNPKQFEAIDIKEDIQEVKDIIASYTEKMGKSVEEILTSRKRSEAEMKKALKAEIEAVQEALQDKLTEAFPVGDYGDYYEGLVFKLTNGMMFKVTSKKFKQFIAEHNHWTESMKFTESLDEGTQSDNKLLKLLNNTSNDEKVILDKIFGERNDKSQLAFQHIDAPVIKVSLYKDNKLTYFSKTIEKFSLEILNGVPEDDLKKIFNVSYSLDGSSPKMILQNDKKDKVTLRKTGGAAGQVYILEKSNNEYKFIPKDADTKSNAAGDKTPIQELFTGVILDKCLREANAKSLNTQTIIENLKAQLLENKKSLIISNKEYTSIATDKQKLKATILEAIDDSWVQSFNEITHLDLSILTSHMSNISNYIFMHSTVSLSSEKSKYDIISNYLFSKVLYEKSKAYRDTVNPSDIYFIDSTKLDIIINALEIIKSDTFIEDWNRFLSMYEPLASNNKHWKDFKLLQKLGKFLPEEKFTFIHNYLLSKSYIIGISLKKLLENGHVSFTGGEKFFFEESNLLSLSRFVIDLNDSNNNTIKDYTYSWGVSGKANDKLTIKGKEKIVNTRGFSQGGFKIEATANKQDLLNTGNPKDTTIVELNIRTSGGNSPSIESRVGEVSGAQGGKGKNGLELLINNKKLSENKLFSSALCLLAETGDLKQILENSPEPTMVLSNGVYVSLNANVNKELIPTSNTEVIEDFWNKTELNHSKYKNLSKKDINIQNLAAATMNFIKGNIPLSDPNLEKIIALAKDEKLKEIFRLTLLCAKSLKYQVFLSGGDEKLIDTENRLNSAISAKDYLKSTFNNSVVSYFKIS